MTSLETIYLRLPVWLQNTFCSIDGWRIQRSRFGGGFRRHLQAAEIRGAWSNDRLNAYRDKRLREFVAHAAGTVPYYRALFRKLGIDPQRIRGLDDLKLLPILTKAEVQDGGAAFLSDRVPSHRHLPVHTGGTTGAGLQFATTLDAIQEQWAVWWRYRRWHEIEQGTWHGYFGGRSVVPMTQNTPPFWRYNLPGRQILFDGYHLNPQTLPAYIDELRRSKPLWLHGYPSLLTLLATHLLDTAGDLGYQVRWITIGAENLLDHQIEMIQRAFGVRPKQHYGMAEAVANVSECPLGALHVDEDFAATEFLPDPSRGGYRVIGTNLSNLATPLLRYDMQDNVLLADNPCPCGRPGRTLKCIDGRADEYLVTPNGVRLGPATLSLVFKHLATIRESQIVQRQAAEITVRIVRAGGYTADDERELRSELRKRVGDEMRVNVEYVDALQRSGRGKLRLMVSGLPQARLGYGGSKEWHEGPPKVPATVPARTLEDFYQRFPPWLQNTVCSLQGWHIQRMRFAGNFSKRLREAEQRMAWPQERVLAFRDQCLREFVQQAAETVPYYRALFRKLGIDPREIRGIQDLGQLPILTKDDVRAAPADFLSSSVPARRRVIAHTSGTTGSGLHFATTLDALQEQWAVWWRYRRWHGIERNAWCGYFGGRSIVSIGQKAPPFWRYNFPGRQILFSGYHLNARNMPAYVGELRRSRPPWLHGYPSLLVLLAAYLSDVRSDLGYQLRWITTGAENLSQRQAELIERAFGVRPRQHYGMAEAVANISECPLGALHLDEDFSAVEFLPDPSSGACRIIGTNFSNPATPLLRYDTHDMLIPGQRPCPCGRPGRIVEQIDGRSEDYVVLPDGTRLGRMDHVFKDLLNIREAQIYQRRLGLITVRVVRRESYTNADEQQLLAELRKRVGHDSELRIEYLDRLPRSPTEKLRLVVSELSIGHRERDLVAAGQEAASHPAASAPSSPVEFWDDLAQTWNDRYFKRSFRSRIDTLGLLLGNRKLCGQKWLDAGCGTGVLSRVLAQRGCSVIGADVSPAMIEIARKSSRDIAGMATFEVIESLERSPFEACQFDGILCSSVLEYARDPKECCQEIHRMLKPGGLFLVSVPNRRSIVRLAEKACYRASKFVAGHGVPRYLSFSKHEFCLRDFIRYLSEARFQTLTHAYCGSPWGDWTGRSDRFEPLLFVLAQKFE
jgi:phenylacetate-CoA ligase